MGVKSTVDLTRAEAEARWTKALVERLADVVALTDRDLCEQLALLNDQDHGGEGFENYRIIPLED
jgi:hypothetical protein